MSEKPDRFIVVGSEDGGSWGVWDTLAEGQVGFRLRSGRVAYTSSARRMVEELCERMNVDVRNGHAERKVL